MSKQTCYLCVGISGSGKSSIAEALAKFHNAVLVSSDTIRGELSFVEDQSRNEEVFNIFHKRIRDGLNEGSSVIADATNLTLKSRRQIIDIAKRIPNVEIVCVLIATPWGTCIERDKKRNRSVGEEVLRKQLRKFQIPFYEEGFDDIVVVKTMPPIFHTNGILLDMEKAMDDFDQKNPHHKHDLLGHCVLTFNEFERVYKAEKCDYWDGAFYHDLGKLETQTIDENGIAHYYNHENVGAYRYFINRAYDNSKFKGKALLDSTFLINYHMMPFTWKEPKTLEKYKKVFGEETTEMLIYFNERDRSCS